VKLQMATFSIESGSYLFGITPI